MEPRPVRLNLYAQHSRHWRQNRYVYPVISRRSRGLSIGINLNPDTVCNFDCIYCCVDRTVPPKVREVDLEVVAGELDHMLRLATSGELFGETPLDQTPMELRRINDIAFSGDGEPTAFPRFGDACRLAYDAIERFKIPHTRIVVITNATLLQRPSVAEALKWLDAQNGEIWAKLEAGTEAYYRMIERTSIPLARVIENITAAARVRPVVIQSLFMKVSGTGPDDAEIAAYIGRLRQITAAGGRVKLVQVYTVARRPAESFVTPLEDSRLDEIAARVRELGMRVETYYGVG